MIKRFCLYFGLLASFACQRSDSESNFLGEPSQATVDQVIALLDTPEAAKLFNERILVSQKTSPTDLVQSTQYRWQDFMKALRAVANEGIAGQKFYIGSVKSGLINVAVFLGQAMQETIQYDVCDENNWTRGADPVYGTSDTHQYPNYDYPASAACGQGGQLYNKYLCEPKDKDKECPIDTNMMIQASTHARWGGAPPPLFCAPKSVTGPTPRWDWGTRNNDHQQSLLCGPPVDGTQIPSFADMTPNPWIQQNVVDGVDQNTCHAYEGQFLGRFTFDGCPPGGCFNAKEIENGIESGKRPDPKADVEGCCWWGRGVIQTTGPCNIGKLNYYLGAGKRINGPRNVNAKYSDVDFCKNPEAICDPKYPDLKWDAGLLYWLQDVQNYPETSRYDWIGYNKYLEANADEIFDDLAGSKENTIKLVGAASGLVNRGCPSPTGCDSGKVLEGENRFNNFKKAMEVVRYIYDSNRYPEPTSKPVPPATTEKWWSNEVLCREVRQAHEQTSDDGQTYLGDPCPQTGPVCAIRWWPTNRTICPKWARASKEKCLSTTKIAHAWCE